MTAWLYSFPFRFLSAQQNTIQFDIEHNFMSIAMAYTFQNTNI